MSLPVSPALASFAQLMRVHQSVRPDARPIANLDGTRWPAWPNTKHRVRSPTCGQMRKKSCKTIEYDATRVLQLIAIRPDVRHYKPLASIPGQGGSCHLGFCHLSFGNSSSPRPHPDVYFRDSTLALVHEPRGSYQLCNNFLSPLPRCSVNPRPGRCSVSLIWRLVLSRRLELVWPSLTTPAG